KALVYVAAFAPDNGQSINDLLKGFPAPKWASELQKDSGGFLRLSTNGDFSGWTWYGEIFGS
ncbi:MAG TPA: hypothetical protein VN957_09835, partial [Chthoniobacterales bacterium]|nr:hypothetical protein [Chthoniobacterales bacterium]